MKDKIHTNAVVNTDKSITQSIKEMEERLFDRRKNRQMKQEADKVDHAFSNKGSKIFGNRKDSERLN